MNFFKQPFNLAVLSLLYLGVFTSQAQAYLDPGTGSFIIQMLVAGIAGSLFLLKTYWQKLKDWFSGKKEIKENPEKKQQTPDDSSKDSNE